MSAGHSSEFTTGEDLDGYSTIVIPDAITCHEDRILWQRVRTREMLGLPPANGFDAAIRGTLEQARKLKGNIPVAAILTAVRLALAKSHGIRIRTPARGIALHLGIRYATFLKIRRLADKAVASEGKRLQLDLPAWVHWDLD